jgi:aquaporin Z
MGKSLFKAGVAESLGTFILVFVGSSAACMNEFMSTELGDKTPFGLLGVALAYGMALMIGVYATAGISGAHLNPAISLGMMLIGKCDGKRAMTYILFQIIGALIAGLCVMGMFSQYRGAAPYLGTPGFVDNPDLPGALSPLKAIGVETILTFVLMTVICLVAVDGARKGRQMFGVAIGMTLFVCILIGGKLTGAALNPAVYLGPALISGHVSQLLVYIVGPVAGAVVGGLVYKFLLATGEDEPEAAG